MGNREGGAGNRGEVGKRTEIGGMAGGLIGEGEAKGEGRGERGGW